MRILNMLMGVLLVIAGIFMIANEGITFISVAFVVGLLFIIAGIAEVISCNSYRGDEGDRALVLIDGLIMLAIGILIILNKLAADVTVPLVLGFWVLTSGIGNMVRALDKREAKDAYFYGYLIIGILNVIVGAYMFFNNDLLMMSVIVQVGLCILAQGVNAFMVGASIIVFKSDFLKTKEEMLAQAVEDAEKAQEAAKEAIKAVEETKAIVKEIEKTPEELLDAALAPKPGEEIEITNAVIEEK